jgi:N-methylhydantoinase A
VVQVANAAMERAIRRISIERGHDPADFTLLAFGGAGPLHGCELAERLGLPRVLVPFAPGVLSALGMLLADLVIEHSVSVLRPVADLTAAGFAEEFAPWVERALAELRAEQAVGLGGGEAVRLERSADLRYVGQSFEINVPLPSGPADPAALLTDFHARHARRYGHSHPAEPVEVVNLRVRAIAPTPPPAFEPLPAGRPDPAAALVAERPAWFDTQAGLAAMPTRCYDRARLLAGNHLAGPALVFQLDATTVIPPGWSGRVDQAGHLLLERAGGARA